MKLQKVQSNYNYTAQNNGVSNNNHRQSAKQNPAFGNFGAPLVSLATFIENNGFLGEFLTIDTCGMMGPRTIQGYTRNREELGHLNYKAGREELVRELLSGPAYFFVPLAVISAAGILRGKCAKVNNTILDGFKKIMGKTSADIKKAAEIKSDFVSKLCDEAFTGYGKETGLIDNIKELLQKTVNNEVKAGKAGKEAEGLLTTLNKANGKLLDNAGSIELGKNQLGISSLFKDVKNYLDHFTKSAEKTGEVRETFIEKFHQKAKDLRNITNILAVGALSAFLLIIPKLYQTDKKFPGKDGLVDDNNTTPSAGVAPEADGGKEEINVSK